MKNSYVRELFRSIVKQVENTTDDASARFQFIVGDISSSDASLLLDLVSNYCHTHDMALEFWLAEHYKYVWTTELTKFASHFAEGNLTQYRNSVVSGSLQILLGTDHIVDKGSLADFYRCDGSALWEESMNSSFSEWIKSFFEERNVSSESEEDNVSLDSILKYLAESHSLQQISALLDSVPTDADYNIPRDVIEALLSKLGDFNLPNMSGFVYRKQKKRSFRYYGDAAAEFLNYQMFIEPSKQNKSLKAVTQFHNRSPHVEMRTVAPFDSEDDLLHALTAYIKTGSQYKAELRQSDFVAILDDILGAKPASSGSAKKDTVKKLSGSPAEVVLSAVWGTVGAFSAQHPGVVPEKIEIKGEMYRHDHPVQGLTEAEIKNDVATPYLKKLLGGLDVICEDGIKIPLSEGETVAIESNLINDDYKCVSAKTAEPFFQFSVEAYYGDDKVKLRYALQLPDTHPYRLAILLFEHSSTFLKLNSCACKLPVFHLAYYKELMLARDEDEIRRVMMHSIEACDSNEFGSLLFRNSDWWNQPQTAPLRSFLLTLDGAYSEFVNKAFTDGLYSVIKPGSTPGVISAYAKALEAYTGTCAEAANSHPIAAMLMRSFLVVDKHPADEIVEWGVKKYEPSGIVTILHPAMLEMVQAQVQFLFESFSSLISKELTSPATSRTFKDARWRYYVDMAQLKMPLVGLPVENNSMRFVVSSGGDDLIHRIGTISTEQKLAATRFLTRYDRVDDDDISDAEMFRETSESRHLFRIMREYYTIHTGAKDGMSIAVYRNEDVQPVLAAIDQFAKWMPKEGRLQDSDRPEKYAMKVVFFSESSDTSVVSSWLSRWQDFLDESSDEESGYSAMRFTVSHRIVRKDDGYKQFADTIKKDVDADIFVFYNFIKPDSEGCEFQVVNEFDVTKADIKFPILEQSQCVKTALDEKFKRSQIVSNRQFKLSSDHVEVVSRLRDTNCGQNLHHIVLATGDYKPWKDVINRAHDSSEWVVCIDALIDKTLLAISDDNQQHKRELIGFGSGVGLHGEKNYTVSTQKYSIETIRKQLVDSMGKVYKFGTAEQFQVIAKSLLEEATELAGLSMIRSLGPSDYVRDFMAYCVMHKILPLHPQDHLCDRIFSIDAYSHWFDQASGDDKKHPDLLWIRADIDDEGKFKLSAKLIECKMAHQNPEHLEKATEQIENGLCVLSDVFKPKGGTSLTNADAFGGSSRPDSRYWYLQLHRLLAGSVHVEPDNMGLYLSAMERLASGEFEIEWDAGIFTFWTDSDSSELKQVQKIPVDLGITTYNVPVYEAGCKFVHRLCVSEPSPELSWSDTSLPTGPLPSGDDMPVNVPPEDTDAIDEPLPLPVNATMPDIPDVPPEPPKPTDVSDDPPSTPAPQPVNVAQPVAQSSLPDRILLGIDTGNKKVYWEFGHPKLNNRHFLIFGNSGMGKTYAIQAILCELGRKGQNSLIVDYTNGFLGPQLQGITNNVLHPKQHIVKTMKLPLNPFKKHSQDVDVGVTIEDNDIDVAKRITSIFDSVYQMGEQQVSILIDAIQIGLQQFAETMSLDKVLPILQSFLNDGIHPKGSVQTLIGKLKPFIDTAPFKSDSLVGWAELFGDEVEKCHVFQMVMIDKSTARILTEFILWDLWAYASNGGSETKPRIVVLDEVQNLDQRLESPLGKYMTEGRKFGLCVMAATQTLSNLSKDEQSRLFQSGHKLFFRPADPEVNQYADFVAQASGYDKNQCKSMLTSLSKGECLSVGPALDTVTGSLKNKVCKIKISALEDRGF